MKGWLFAIRLLIGARRYKKNPLKDIPEAFNPDKDFYPHFK